MSRHLFVFMFSAALAMVTLNSHAIAQQKTVKACQDEWRANKAANQASGVTLKAYVAECRGGASAQPTAVPASGTAAPRTSPTPVTGGQKTVKACQDEWRANKAANQASGVTLKAYVAECRGGASAQPTAVPASGTAAPRTRPTQATGGQKTIKACQDEWRANKAANQASGVTLKAYVAECRGGSAPTQSTVAPSPPVAPAPAPTAAPAAPARTPTATAPRGRPASPESTAKPVPSTPTEPTGANQFSTEAQAKARCPSDTVVWVNLVSKIYHFSGSRSYGTTKKGAYMCESDTAAEGMRAAKNESRP